MNSELLKLKHLLEACGKHAQRTERAHSKLALFVPLNGERFGALDEDQIEHIDQYIYRFSKLQDTLGDKLFKALLEAAGENVRSKPFIDIFNRLDELEVVSDYDLWVSLRKIRNEISHDYDMTDDEIARSLNKIYDSWHALKGYYENIKQFAEKKFNLRGVSY